jgi:hypothetical protein
MELRPESDGSTSVVDIRETHFPIGTRIQIAFGGRLQSDDKYPLSWINSACNAASGESYNGKSSPYWYDGAQFHEFLFSAGAQPVRSLIAELDGCSGGKAGDIVTAAGLDRKACNQVDRGAAINLLKAARQYARPVNPKRLGGIGPDLYADMFFAVERDEVKVGTVEPLAEIPCVIEAWARKDTDHDGSDHIDVSLLINRTPSVDEVSIWRSGKRAIIRGAGLRHYVDKVPRKGSYSIIINVTAPYCPITSDGKAPDLETFAGAIIAAVDSAIGKVERAAPKEKKVSITDSVLKNLDALIALVSGGKLRFQSRQLLYRLRPIVKREADRELRTGTFNAIITEYESENGEIPLMYREPRGSISHPHEDDDIPLGTLTVEEYERPIWTYNKLLYIEKEGFKEALKEVGWRERHDCCVISSKGFTSRAARDLVDKLAAHDEPVEVFCAIDADAYSTTIYDTFQNETKARDARKIKIINLGLHPWDAVASGFEVEDVEKEKKRKPVGNYVRERDAEYSNEAPGGILWEEWLQTHRIELNAMTTPEFIAWLDARMAEHGSGKLIPPDDVIADELKKSLETKIRNAVTERILLEAGYENQVAKALAAIERPTTIALIAGIKESFTDNLENQWRKHIDETARILAKPQMSNETVKDMSAA